MSFQTFTAAVIFALAMGLTPGPNNVMLAASGSRFGIRRTLPHLAGVTVGFPVMLFLVGLGLAASKGEARMLIKGGGARVGADKVTDEALIVTVGAEAVRIAAGKKHHGLLVSA